MRGVLSAAMLAGVGGCGGPHSAFVDPASEAAAAIDRLWWLLLLVTLLVFVAVLAGWAYALFRQRGSAAGGSDSVGREPGGAAGGAGVGEVEGEGRSLLWILIAGAIVPALILTGLTVATIRTSSRIAGAAGSGEALLVEVVGHQFWWEARYPESGAVTANEIHIPAGRPVRLRLTSNDVIHSLWIPRLQGKLDMTPGRTTELLLRPEEPGVYRGFCAEFCGSQHALMGLLVVAQEEEAFDRWLARNAAPATVAGEGPAEGAVAPPEPGMAAGAAVFTRYECHFCHRVRGADFRQPTEDVGPDLTHLASRETLAAATMANTPENLAAWILDPARFKPGARMPATPMSDEELRALVRYLEALR